MGRVGAWIALAAVGAAVVLAGALARRDPVPVRRHAARAAPSPAAELAAPVPQDVPRAAPRRRPRLPAGTGVAATLRRAVLRGQVAHRDGRRWQSDLRHARAVLGRLTGARGAELRTVLSTLDGLAASGRLTVSRMPLAFLTVRRNTTQWRRRPFPAPAQRMTFGRDPTVFQYFPGRGVQVHGLATAGRANALAAPCLRAAERRTARAVARVQRLALRRRVGLRGHPVRPRPAPRPGRGCHPSGLRRRLDRLVALSSSRGGFRAWEYLFAYGGGTAPWVSAMTQATAAQALARGAVALDEPRYRRAALEALGAFETAPPVGVALRPPGGGRQFLMYSFAPSLRILNGFLQSVIGLHDVADLTGSARAARLYRLGERTARRSVAAFDTGAWSRYAFAGQESTLGYHELVTGFLAGMCERTGRPAYCDEAERFGRYLREPPRLRLRAPARLREERPAALRLWVSKVSAAVVTVRDRHGIVLDRSGRLPRGRYAYAFVPPRPGRYRVRVSATGPEGRRAVLRTALRVAAEPRPKPRHRPHRARRRPDRHRPRPPRPERATAVATPQPAPVPAPSATPTPTAVPQVTATATAPPAATPQAPPPPP